MLRADISAKDSPPGNRNPLGQRCTVGHSLVLYSRANDFSVQSPTSASIRPVAVRTRRPEGRGDGGRRFPGPLQRRGVDGRRRLLHGGDPLGRHRGLGPSLVGQVQPGGPPGQHLAGGRACPWRTSRTTVAGGPCGPRRATRAGRVRAGGRRARAPIVGSAPCHPTGPGRTRWPQCSRRWRTAGAARAWSNGVSRWRRTAAASFAGQTYWGRGVPGIRRPPGAAGHRRPGTGRARGQPHRAHVHRRPLGRLALRRAASGRVRLAAHQHARATGWRLHGAYITAAVHCAPPANKPDPAERAACAPYLARELELLREAQVVVVALGQFAWQAWPATTALPPRPKFGHLAEQRAPGRADPARLVPPEPTEHLHRQADRADVRRRVRPGPPR